MQVFLKGLWNRKENEILLGQLLKFEEAYELMVVYQCRFPDLECCMLVIWESILVWEACSRVFQSYFIAYFQKIQERS